MKIIAPNPTKYQIPFDRHGDVLSMLLGAHHSELAFVLKDNYYFQDILKFVDLSGNIELISVTNNKTYKMTQIEFFRSLGYLKIENGLISGIFTFRKYGDFYTLKIVNPNDISVSMDENVTKETRNRLNEIDE